METNTKNKEAVKNLFQAFETGNTTNLNNFIADNVIDHNLDPGMSGKGIDLVKNYIKEYKNGFPDLKIQLEAVIAEGDQVIAHTLLTGTHKGDFWGIQATNKKVNVEGYDRFKVVNGKITERWGIFDQVSFFNQIGVLPKIDKIIEKATAKEAVL